MLLLDYHNKIIEDTLLEKFNDGGKHESIEATIADFDGVLFHLSSDGENKNILKISLSMKCFSELKKQGVDDVLHQQYGSYVSTPESGYDATLVIDLDKPPTDIPATARNIALLKRHCLAAPFYKVFADIDAKRSGSLIELNYRDGEALYIKPDGDKAVVIFVTSLRDPDDVVLAKVFLQEYQDGRRTMSNAPSVTYSQKDPPLELKGVRNLRVSEGTSYVSFVLFAPHMGGKKKETTIDSIITFRNHLQYHMKCSKAYLHTRMRNRVRTFLQVLNRAKSDPKDTKEKKTITGKTFSRADDPQGSSQALDFNI